MSQSRKMCIRDRYSPFVRVKAAAASAAGFCDSKQRGSLYITLKTAVVNSTTAVSYTHLDVYKRQVHHLTRLSRLQQRDLTLRSGAVSSLTKTVLHPDVYKRQIERSIEFLTGEKP